MASLIPVSACQQVSGLRTVSCLFAFLLQIIQQLPEHKHPESTNMGVHSASLGSVWVDSWVHPEGYSGLNRRAKRSLINELLLSYTPTDLTG
jgi:hypothetical protein